MNSLSTCDNQLKFNLNAIVDNLNLVNLVHQPNAIIIDKNIKRKITNYERRSRSDFENNEKIFNNTKNNFQYIDEEKLSMYSFLVERELKEKERLSKYNFIEHQKNELNKNDDDDDDIKIKKTNDKNKNNNFNSNDNLNKNKKIKKSPIKNKHVAFSSSSSLLLLTNNSVKNNLNDNKKLQHKHSVTLNDELEKLFQDSIKTIKYLEKQLNECKFIFNL